MNEKPLVTVSRLKTLPESAEVSFEALRGETVCLFGMNGSGKTLLIKSLCGIFKPFLGSLEFAVPRKLTGICLQFPEHLVFKDTALKEAALITGDEKTGGKLLEEIGAAANTPPFFMSDGQKRLLFVLGLIDTKDILIFDEPFASLDPLTKEKVKLRIKTGAEEGKAFIYSANREADAAWADKIIKISRAGPSISLKI